MSRNVTTIAHEEAVLETCTMSPRPSRLSQPKWCLAACLQSKSLTWSHPQGIPGTPPATCFFTLQYLHVFVHSFSLLLPAKGKLRKEPWSRVSKTSLVHHRRSSCSSRFQKEAGDLWSCYSGFHHYVLYVYIYLVTIRPMHPGTISCHPKLCQLCLRPSGKTLGVTKKCRSCPSTISCGDQNRFVHYAGVQIELACNVYQCASFNMHQSTLKWSLVLSDCRAASLALTWYTMQRPQRQETASSSKL